MFNIIGALIFIIGIGFFLGVIVRDKYIIHFCEKQSYVELGGFGQETLVCIVNYKD